MRGEMMTDDDVDQHVPVQQDGRERNGRSKAISCTGDLHEWAEFIWWH